MSLEGVKVTTPSNRGGVPTVAGGDVYAVLARGADTNGGYYLTHAIVPPGGGPWAHVHTREEEAFYVISGELTFLAGEEERTVPAGSFVHIPRGTKHRFRNASDVDAEMIFWFTPPGIEGLFDELIERPEDAVAIGERYGTKYFFDD